MLFELTDESRMKLHDIRNHLQLLAGRRALREKTREQLLSSFEEAVGQVQEGRPREEVERTLRDLRGRFGEFEEHDRAVQSAFNHIMDIIFDTSEAREPTVISLGDLVRKEVAYCHTDLRKLPADRLVFSEANRPYIRAVPVRVTRMLHNLIYNAAEALSDDGGSVEVLVDLVGVASPRPGLLGPIEPGTYAVLTVSDEGEGIPEHQTRQVFERGFSTRGGEHDGLGMALIRAVIEESDGNLELTSGEPRGTTVRVYLPAVSAPESS